MPIDEPQVYVTHPSNIDKVIDKVLTDRGMSPAKIRAFATLVQALKGQVISEPNTVEDKKEELEGNDFLAGDSPPDFSEVEGIEIDGQKKGAIKIYKTGLTNAPAAN